MPPAFEASLDLGSTLYSGQAFRWRPSVGGWHEGFVANHPVRVRQARGRLEWEAEDGVDATDLRAYFRVDGTHERFLREVRRDGALDRALAAYPGLRLLAQDPWEVFVAYIVSANSNVAKISRTLEALAFLAGEPSDAAARHAFPTPDAMARLNEAQLRSTGMGYRAPHLRAAVQLVARGDLDPHALARLPYEEAHALLVEAPGIGAKVADCILLYGCGHFGAFPIDVWIDRVLREEYFPRKRLNYRAWGEWARDHFGPWAGYAQHYLFHERRLAGPERAAMAQARRRRASSSVRSSRSAATPFGGAKATPS
jgi:N-glycosylase/DNA lyase